MILAIYCAGGLGKEIIALARSVMRWEEIIFVDDITNAEWYEQAKVYRFEEIKALKDNVEFVIASGEPAVREKIYLKIKDAGYAMATLIDNGCAIHPSARIDEGCILYDCNISADVLIKPNVFISTKAAIGHDVTVQENSIISAFCFIGGFSLLEERVYMGAGSMVKDRIKVRHDSILSLGAVILRNTKPKAIMLGNPAQCIGMNENGKVFGMFD